MTSKHETGEQPEVRMTEAAVEDLQAYLRDPERCKEVAARYRSENPDAEQDMLWLAIDDYQNLNAAAFAFEWPDYLVRPETIQRIREQIEEPHGD